MKRKKSWKKHFAQLLEKNLGKIKELGGTPFGGFATLRYNIGLTETIVIQREQKLLKLELKGLPAAIY